VDLETELEESGSAIDEIDSLGNTALMWAVKRSDISQAMSILETQTFAT
jgi:ankyrin repeat protein